MQLEDLIATMREPGFYPQPSATVEFRQTHISCVFLTDEHVYKIKKPLHLSFLDYSTLERRYHFCREEVRLNQRLTPRVYLGVYAIWPRDSGLFLGANPVARFDARAAEYAVKMRRLPDDRSLERLVQAGRIDAAGMRRIGLVLAKFHAAAGRERSVEYGCADAIDKTIATNLDECRPFAGESIGEREFNWISSFSRAFIERHRDLLDRRARQGMVREGHGDLRCEHICLTENIDIIDCVEFSERLRYADIASDVAFLLMDLDRLRAPALGDELMCAYAVEIADPELNRLLNFYKCFRALVRAKVGGLKAREGEVPPAQRARAAQSARNHFAAAWRYSKAGAPVLIVICGLPASGKSTVAQALVRRSGFAVFNSDVIRKRLAGIEPTEHGGAGWKRGIYTPEFTEATYNALAEAALQTLRGGDGVIIDATYADATHRGRLREVGHQAAVPVVFAECTVSDEQARQRLQERELRPGAVSDATWQTYLGHKARFAPFGQDFAGCHLRLGEVLNPADAAFEIEQFIANYC